MAVEEGCMGIVIIAVEVPGPAGSCRAGISRVVAPGTTA